MEVLIEEFVAGSEFCVDGPVLAGRYHPLLLCSKPDYDDERHTNQASWPPRRRTTVRSGAPTN